MRKYYSQNGEDCLLWVLFGTAAKGFFIDVGAFDGVHLSNSYSFEENGWQGICIEAHPDYFPMLERNRPGSLCLPYACVGNRNQKTVDFQMEKMGLLSSVLDSADYQEDVKSRYEARGLPFEGFKTARVPAATLDELLERYYDQRVPIDFISIDVEGYEIEVLKGFDSDLFSPRIILVEANSDQTRETILRILTTQRGYRFAGRLAENLIFTREAKDVKKLRAIKLDCRIEKQSHPLGDEYSTPKYLRGKDIGRANWTRLTW